MAETQEEIDSYIELYWADRMEAFLEEEEAEEEAERRESGSGGEMKKRKTAAGVGSKKAAAAADPVEESDNEEGAVESISQAKSNLSRRKKIINAKIVKLVGVKSGEGRKPKTMTEDDVAAAAVYRAKGEEAYRIQDRKAELDAVIKWIATGDPEAIEVSDQWMAENVEAMKLEPKDPTDWPAERAKDYREFWDLLWAGSFGKWEDITLIQPMRYTDEKPPQDVYPVRTLQVFSVKVAAIAEELGWPLDVFGIVAARDSLDHNRNIIFRRQRDNCQTIDSENRCLTLTGPTRAIVVVDPVYFEVDLQVKGRTESEDRALSYLVVNYRESGCESHMFKRVDTSKLSTVELTLGDMAESVEATISVKVVDGEWPEGFGCLISARTASISDMEIKLLAFDKLPVAADGTIQLSRCVLSVEADGMLRVSVMAMANCLEDQTVEGDSKAFKAREASRSTRMLQVCSCKLEVTIAWSLVPAMV
ncbi:hypothetical protein CFC21_000554 [Triticum aestivum]|uniref:DUF6598 domain-containing protein n=1 Tax=Triticum aestivum TaxID=4565 RepID=A0A3B5XVG2_WHEAT|nr:uncharacterized protein LOC123081317 [Triticum aestivum]KAF6982122.1 hypothetical protein CFC21_000554 [Triticum aestivum]